jgi:hypothetical protein
MKNVPLPIMSSLGTLEQRKTDRIFCQRAIRLCTSDQREFTVVCTDVNQTGIGVESERVLSVGQRVELVLAREQRVPMLVMYRMGQHYGLSALGSYDSVLEILPQQ